MYVRAYLAIPCVSAKDNVKYTKSNIRYDNKINKNETNVKYIRIHVYEYTEVGDRTDVRQQPSSSRQKAEIHKQIWW